MSERSIWKSCYGALQEVLVKHGVESAFGEADYWLVDDDYGEFDQKICVFRASFLQKRLLVDLQQVLKQGFPAWRIYVVLEIPALMESGYEEGGLLIYPDRIDENLDRKKIELKLGEPLNF